MGSHCWDDCHGYDWNDFLGGERLKAMSGKKHPLGSGLAWPVWPESVEVNRSLLRQTCPDKYFILQRLPKHPVETS